MKSNFKKLSTGLIGLSTFFISYAQSKNVTGVVQNETISKIQSNILTEIVSPLLGLATAVTFVLFLYGVVRFLLARANGQSEKFEAGRWHLIWGAVGLTILLSLWGILTSIASFTGSNIWFAK
jgi:hypothetical protein